ncbi:uncharacterized protein LOC120206573 [Hibiscus syriacus]|uniref:uncharacterized protein LOC120206573 n=1 Tax=Hibiscus syriacus TaxID=106335 RepID=UPI0019218875|nr:uncharacterized protein LOC120206573 [Hibiscus syriacus]
MKPKKLIAADVERRCPVHASAVPNVDFHSTRDVRRHLHSSITLSIANTLSFFDQNTHTREDVFANFAMKAIATPPPFIKGKYHEHPFTLFWKQASFICDACGLEGNSVSYTCSACNFVIHPKCASIPPIIKVPRHDHPIFHNYFLSGNELKNRDCKFCDTEVNIDYGCYYCSDDEGLDDDLTSINPITCFIEQNETGEMIRIKHFSHAHDLILSDNFTDNDKTCDGCMLQILTSFYYCSSYCDFYLHKSCAESLRKKLRWFHAHLQGLILIVGYIFKCNLCDCESSGFAYKCEVCNEHFFLPSVVDRDYRIKHPAHEHPLFFLEKVHGNCKACGESWVNLHRCKRCDFNLDFSCQSLPLTVRDRRDEHPLALTYQEGNDYSEYLYCDICEKERDPNHWFYRCETCDLSAHLKCVPQSRLLIKPGSKFKAEGLHTHPPPPLPIFIMSVLIKPGSMFKEEVHHQHPLTFVRKPHCYLSCRICSKLCEDLALECADSTCNYTVNWECVKPADFGRAIDQLRFTELKQIVKVGGKQDYQKQGSMGMDQSSRFKSCRDVKAWFCLIDGVIVFLFSLSEK